VDEHASSWAAGERFGLHGDRSGRLDSAAAALLLEQWLREGPEALGPALFSADPVDPAAIAVGTRAGADSF
jgi:putative Holliday junction resolvase